MLIKFLVRTVRTAQGNNHQVFRLFCYSSKLPNTDLV